MDDQSFELLLSKLDSLEAGQSRIETTLTKRLDGLNDQLIIVERDINFAKGVTYAINGLSVFIAWLVGWSKH